MGTNPLTHKRMKKISYLSTLVLLFSSIQAQSALDLPVRGFCISAPDAAYIDTFTQFIREEFIPRKVNTLVLRVDYNYEYTSHPELRDKNALSSADIKKLVEVCREGGIRLIPQLNLLGHQSWHSEAENLLKVYPQFDETPHIGFPEEYKWPNDDGLYCKSYCPLHPEVHKVVFELVDELMEVFEADAFHAGMDEVFYLGDDKCPRCGGRNKAELFAGEVTRIRNHLDSKGWELWIWGDRLIDGKTTGIGMWEASMNNTHPAIDLIPKDVVICDWHYPRAVPTPPIFAAKGLRVVSCPWRMPAVAVNQVQQQRMYRKNSPKEMQGYYYGMLQTIWTSPKNFIDQFYNRVEYKNEQGHDMPATFRALFEEVNRKTEE